jgi:hypothetical protein
VNGGALTSSGTFANAGTFTKASAGTTTLAGAFTNAGTVNASAGVLDFAGGYTQSAGQVVLGGGSVAGDMTINGGTLGGVGSIAGNVNNNGGILSVGASPGTLTIAGNFIQGPGGVLNIELGGTTQGVNYDLLQVTGTANLNGTMNVTLFGGFVPAAGNLFDVITYASRTGDFATVNPPTGASLTATPNASFYQLAILTPPVIGGSGSSITSDAPFTLPAVDVKVLNDKFIATVEAAKQPEDEERKGAVLECK